MKVFHDEPMARHTTFRVGGPAERFVEIDTEEELAEEAARCAQEGVPFAVVGRGSNLLVADEGFHGTVICTAGGFSTIRVAEETPEGAVLHAESGATLSALAGFAGERALTGLEFAAGIPGTVGGGIIMNAGAFGGELGDVTARVYTVDREGNRRSRSREEMAFGYRVSALKGTAEIVTGADFFLKRGDRAEIARTAEELSERRREKQPLNYASAGSTWKRPPGDFAARLIEAAGCKGLSVGGAQISEKHAGFLVNRGGASAADIRALMALVEKRVYENSGVRLEPEIVLLGF